MEANYAAIRDNVITILTGLSFPLRTINRN